MTDIQAAIALLKAQGYSVTKRKPKAPKATVRGPTCVALFSDGETTRMTCHCSDEALDWSQGERMSVRAWQSRDWQRRANAGLKPEHRDYREAPSILSIRFERDGETLGSPLARAA